MWGGDEGKWRGVKREEGGAGEGVMMRENENDERNKEEKGT